MQSESKPTEIKGTMGVMKDSTPPNVAGTPTIAPPQSKTPTLAVPTPSTTTVAPAQTIAQPPTKAPHGAILPKISGVLMHPPVMTGPALSKELGAISDTLSIYVEFCDVTRRNRETLENQTLREMKVTFGGMWDGKMLKAAIRSIERSYKQIKYEVLKQSAAMKAQKEAK